MKDETLEAALDYIAEQGIADKGLLPREFYYRLRLGGNTSWPVFRSSSLPTFPTTKVGSNQNKNK